MFQFRQKGKTYPHCHLFQQKGELLSALRHELSTDPDKRATCRQQCDVPEAGSAGFALLPSPNYTSITSGKEQ